MTRTGATAGRDAHGNSMTGDRDTIDLYDRAVDRYLRFHPDVLDLVGQLSAPDVAAPMSHVLAAYLGLSSTDPADLSDARGAWEALSVAAGNERERAHGAVIGAWLEGRWGAAARGLDDLLCQWPTDLLAVMIGHQLDFFLGEAQSLRDRPNRALRELDPGDHHTGFVRGMAAFGVEEIGDYARALDTGLMAVDANPDDVWAIHAVVHTYEMQGRVDEGIHFLASPDISWRSDNMFTVHNWWHLALYHLEAGQPDRALAIYDAKLHNADSAGVPIEMLDASSLLWRLRLNGVSTGARFGELADAWAAKATDDSWYAFNDLHAVMAFAGAGRLDDARAFIRQREAWLPSAVGSNARMSAEIGLPASRAVLAFVEDRHSDVVAELLPIRRVLHHFGGSHAQRDALQRTLIESALGSRQYPLARALTAERLAVRESSTFDWSRRARSIRGLGDATAATAAEQMAIAHSERVARSTADVSTALQPV